MPLQRGRGAQVVQQVAQVVQQRGGHEFVGRILGLGQRRRLQRMLELRDRLAAVLLAAALDEQLLDFLQGQGHGSEYVLRLVKLFIASCTPSL